MVWLDASAGLSSGSISPRPAPPVAQNYQSPRLWSPQAHAVQVMPFTPGLGTQPQLVVPASHSPGAKVFASVPTNFDLLDTNGDGVVSRAEFEAAIRSSSRQRDSVRSVSPLPVRGATVVSCGAPVQPCAVSPLRSLEQARRSPVHQRVVPQVRLSSSPHTIEFPVQSTWQQHTQLVQGAQPCSQVTSLHPASQEARAPANAKMNDDLLQRIDGVVSDMEKELSIDLAACVQSPLGDIQPKAARGNGITPAEGGGDCTLEWIDKQIWAIEHRREACEMRHTQLADLRRLVGDSERGISTGKENDDERIEAQEGISKPARQLAQLEAEHEQLKHQVEGERQELLRVRSSLEAQCEQRLQEIRNLAEAVEEGKQRAWAAEEAANQRVREAELEVNVLQERSQELETVLEQEREEFKAAQEARATAGADLKQLEDNSRAVLGDCRVLQHQVHELEKERASLQAKIRQLEQDAPAQVRAGVEAHGTQLRENAKAELEQMRCNIEADYLRELEEFKAKHKEEWDVNHAQRLEQHKDEADARHAAALEEFQAAARQDKEKMEADKTAEAEARRKLEQQHQQVLHDVKALQNDQARLQRDKEVEQEAKEEVIRQHEAAQKDAEQLRIDKQILQEDQELEQKARRELEQKHAMVTQDLAKIKDDQARLQEDVQKEAMARKQAEEAHAALAKDMETVRADKERVEKEKQEEIKMREDLAQKHADALRESEELAAANNKLQEDVNAEQCAKAEVARLHQAVLDEKNSLHGNHDRLQELLDAEQKAKDEFQNKHTLVEQDKRQVEQEKMELQQAKEAEERMRKLAEQKHAQLEDDMAKMRADQAKLEQDRQAEQRALAEASKQHDLVLKDKQRLEADHQRLKNDKEQEVKAKQELIKKHDDVSQDLAKVQSDARKLQMDRERETRAREELDKRHQAVVKDLEQVQSDQQKLRADKDSEARAKADLERKHEAVLQDVEQMKSVMRRLEADKEAETRLKDDAVSRHGVSKKEMDKLEADYRKLQAELRQVSADRDKHISEHGNTKKIHEEAVSRMKSIHDEEASFKQSLHTEEISRLKQIHEEEAERIKIHHNAMLVNNQKLIEEMQDKIDKLEKERSDTIANMRRQMDQLEERHSEARRRESVQMQSLRFALETAEKKGRSMEQHVAELKDDELERLQREKMEIAADLDHVRKQKEQMQLAEEALRSAVRNETELCGELKVQNQQLKTQLSDVLAREEDSNAKERKLQLDIERLLQQLGQEQQEGETLKLALEEARKAGEQLQQDASDAMQKSDQVKQQLEITWRQKVEEKEHELQALKDNSAYAAGQSPTQRLSRLSVASPGGRLLSPTRKLSTQYLGTRALFAEPMVPPRELLPSSSHPLIVKVREAHAGLDVAMANADQVHLTALGSEFQAANDSLKKGMLASSGFLNYESKSQIELERQAATSRLEARLHDLSALKEETAVHHDLDGSTTKQQILEYINHDATRCEEEMQLFKNSALRDLPEDLIEAVLDITHGNASRTHQRGFSPAHWAAEKGRRDLVLFILQQAGGEAMLRSTDDMGRTPLFYAERNKFVGLAHYLETVLGSGIPSFKPLQQQPDVSQLPAPYRKALEQIESRGWHTVKWKDNYTMLHWAAGKGHKDLCSYLIHLNADLTLMDGQARTPYDCAAAAGHSSIAQLLQDAQNSGPPQSMSKLAFTFPAPKK